jgi:alpha-amylase
MRPFLPLACGLAIATAHAGSPGWEPAAKEHLLRPITDDDPDFRYTPSPGDWRDAPIYQIMTDRFEDGDPSNNQLRGWFGAGDRRKAQGGDWRGITRRLDYLRQLGVKTIWISCVHRNHTFDETWKPYHAYHPTDLFSVEPQFGTLGDLRTLVREAHRRGIYVAIDVVVNHLANLASLASEKNTTWHPAGGGPLVWDRKLCHAPPFNRLDWFHNHGPAYVTTADGDPYGDPDPESNQNEMRGEFIGGLDDLNYDIPEVADAMALALTLLVDATDCDAMRVDAVKHVSHSYLASVFSRVRAHAARRGKTNFLVFGEAFEGNPQTIASFINGREMNSMMNFPVHFAVGEVFGKGAPTKRLAEPLAHQSLYTEEFRDQMVLFLDTHDVARLAGLCEDDELMNSALLFLFTAGQVPCLYYGTEQGFDGPRENDAQRETMFDGEGEVDQGPAEGDNFDTEHPRYLFIEELLRLRKEHAVLRHGRFEERWVNPDGPGAFAYTRSLPDAEALVAFNTSDQPQEISPAVSAAAGSAFADLLDPEFAGTVDEEGKLPLTLPAKGRRLLVVKR